MCPVHSAHVHLRGTQSEEDFPGHWICTINRIKNRRLGVEREIAADRERVLLRIPDIASAAESVGADAERRMVFGDAEPFPIVIAQELVFIDKFQPRVEIVSIQKVDRRFRYVTVQVEDLVVVAFVVTTPDQTRGPVSSLETSVVTDGRGGPSDVARRKR